MKKTKLGIQTRLLRVQACLLEIFQLFLSEPVLSRTNADGETTKNVQETYTQSSERDHQHVNAEFH